MPEWLARLKNDFYQRRLSYQHLSEICEVAIKAALKDQELAGIDVVSDGELRRDNDIDYLLARIPGDRDPQPRQDLLLRLLRDRHPLARCPARRASRSAWPRTSPSPRPRPTGR